MYVHVHGLSVCYFVSDTCSYRLNKEDVIVSELFELLESVRDQIGIVDWGIKMTTLEDGMELFVITFITIIINFYYNYLLSVVFLNIVQNYGNNNDDDDGGSYCPTWLPCKCLTIKSSTE